MVFAITYYFKDNTVDIFGISLYQSSYFPFIGIILYTNLYFC
jgi:hypothetical protein